MNWLPQLSLDKSAGKDEKGACLDKIESDVRKVRILSNKITEMPPRCGDAEWKEQLYTYTNLARYTTIIRHCSVKKIANGTSLVFSVNNRTHAAKIYYISI